MSTIIGLELQRRLRGAAWYVLLAVWFLLIGGISFAVWRVSIAATSTTDAFSLQLDPTTGQWLFSTILLLTLGMSLVVVPAIAGSSINGDRESGVLDTTRITLVSPAQIVWGKFFAAFIVSLVFVLVVSPFIVFAAWFAGLSWTTVAAAAAAILAEIAVVCAVSVGLSGLIARPIFSVLATYLVFIVATIGSPLGLALGATLDQTTKTTVVVSWPDASEDTDGSSSTGTSDEEEWNPALCVSRLEERTYPRYDHYWWTLAANPFLIVADATPASLDADGNPADLFTALKVVTRSAQIAPDMPAKVDYCTSDYAGNSSSVDSNAATVLGETIPYWFVGLAAHLVLGLVLMLSASARLKRSKD